MPSLPEYLSGDVEYELVGFLAFFTVGLGFLFLDFVKSSSTHPPVFSLPKTSVISLTVWFIFTGFNGFKNLFSVVVVDSQESRGK